MPRVPKFPAVYIDVATISHPRIILMWISFCTFLTVNMRVVKIAVETIDHCRFGRTSLALPTRLVGKSEDS